MDEGQRHEIWGTFSVKDHCRSGAFRSEVLLYDRLVIPTPPRGEPEELARWEDEGWDPRRLAETLRILGDRAYPVEWNAAWREKWVSLYGQSRSGVADEVAKELAFQVTGETLLGVMPAMAEGVVAVAPYESLQDLREDLRIRRIPPGHERIPPGVLSAVLGREFLVPEDEGRDEFSLLAEAVKVAKDPSYRERRAALYKWQRKFLRDGRTDLESIQCAVTEMDKLVADLQTATKKQRIWTGVRRAFFFAQLVLTIPMAPILPVALANAGIAIGAFTATEKLADSGRPYAKLPEAALLLDAQRRLDLSRQRTRKQAD